MNYNFENNTSKEKEAGKKSMYRKLTAIFTKRSINNSGLQRRLKDGGFVAWPPDKLSRNQRCTDIEISGSRSKNGGYIAYSKNES
jgi:hypothetical protein